jgi:ribosomal protein L40E
MIVGGQVQAALFCRRCGASLPADSAFCNKCGERIV